MRIKDREALLVASLAVPLSHSSETRRRWCCSRNSNYLIGALILLGVISMSVITKFPDVLQRLSQQPQADEEDSTGFRNTNVNATFFHTTNSNFSTIVTATATSTYYSNTQHSEESTIASTTRMETTTRKRRSRKSAKSRQQEEENQMQQLIPTSAYQFSRTLPTTTTATTTATSHFLSYPISEAVVTTNPDLMLCTRCQNTPVSNSHTVTCGILIDQLVLEFTGLTPSRSAQHVTEKHPESCQLCSLCQDYK